MSPVTSPAASLPAQYQICTRKPKVAGRKTPAHSDRTRQRAKSERWGGGVTLVQLAGGRAAGNALEVEPVGELLHWHGLTRLAWT